MCVMVGVKRGSDIFVCDTVGQLADALRVSAGSISQDEPDFCLCNVDIEKLGARTATEADGWPWPQFVIDVLEDGGDA